ncbi:MAG: hypothetical protein AB1458_02320 [Bacteroidota bacterium]
MKNTYFRLAVSGAFVVLAGLFSSFTNNNKVTICHIPPGNPGNCHEITISINALPAHLGHNDTFYCTSEQQYKDVTSAIDVYNSTNAVPSPVEVKKVY